MTSKGTHAKDHFPGWPLPVSWFPQRATADPRVPERHLLHWLCESLCVDSNKLWKILHEMGIPDHLTWEICMQVKKQQLGLDMKQGTGSKVSKEHVKAVYCHPAYLTYMQSTSWEMLDWMTPWLESRLQGEISIISVCKCHQPYGRKWRRTKGIRDQIVNICWIMENQRDSRKTSTSALLTMLKPLTMWITTNCGKFLKRWAYQTI